MASPFWRKVVPMEYLYEIAGLRVLCQIPYPLTIKKESVAFLHPPAESGKAPPPVDLQMQFRPAAQLPPGWQQGAEVALRYHLNGPWGLRTWFCPGPGQPPYACVTWPAPFAGQVLCEYLPAGEKYVNYSRNLYELLGLENLLLQFGGLLLHSSFIRWQGQGVLFSAPSGTGKSTQADLWAQYEGAEVLNGDRSALRPVDGRWTAFGLPYAGTSGIYRNESAPLRAIVVLRQAKQNRIRPMNAAEAFRFLLPEFTIHRWDTAAYQKAMELVLALLAEVPVYLLECLPDRGAVELAKQTLFPHPPL